MLNKRLAALWSSLLAIVLLFALAIPCATQDPNLPTQRPRKVFPKEQEPEDVLRIDTDLVSVDVTAMDAAGRPVKNLRQEDFKVYSDGLEQSVSFFQIEKREGEARPLAIVFALDVSGSMTTEEMNRVRSALQLFSNQLSTHPVLYAVMTFGMRVKTVQKFTSDPGKLDDAIERLTRDAPNGLSTHTYDAVDDAIRLLVRSAPRTKERRLMKRAVLVVTDGFPVGDTVAPQTVIERANAADVSVFIVTLPSYSRMMASSSQTPLPTPLDVSGLAESTGGRNVYANEKDYGPLFRALAEEVTSAYVLAFYPPDEKRRDGQMHTIRVEGPRGLTLRQSRMEYKAAGRQ
ncbi:MAG TPA: VWA domain-containing protein [Pyrinomonadaceae bacterium]|jgi:Ca-activated chloride channel family protein|nr:VWA domain-containing protein [Pyrinomonadaceae bacterium]